MRRHMSIIGGSPVDGGDWIDVLDPSTGERFAQVSRCGSAEVEAAVDAAERAAAAGWATAPPPERAEVLERIAALIRRDAESLAEDETRDTGKPLRQAKADVATAARYFEFYARASETLYGDTIPGPRGRFIYTLREPLGVTAHIIPWNYALQITARTVAPALATGNCCVLKPAEDAPVTPLRLAELALEAGLPPGAFNVIPGYGEEAGAALAASPRIGHMSFTGSREVGVLVAQAAVANIVPVGLELGGKSPNVVFADADVDRAIATVRTALLQNAGQTCSAGTRLLVERPIHERVVANLRESFEHCTIGPGLADPDLGPLISSTQHERVSGFVAEAREQATLVCGGGRPENGDLPPGHYFSATLFDDVPTDARIAREEVFGPVLAVTPFDDDDEAANIANATDYGLVAGVWSRDIGRAQALVRRIQAGQVYVNGYGAGGGVELPFGGYKQSGIGREKGIEALHHYTQTKTVAVEFPVEP
jgi:aldehyde dehydrogenase (NAD+)